MFQNTRLCLQKPGERTASKKIRGLKNKGTKMTCFRQWILVIISIPNNWTPPKKDLKLNALAHALFLNIICTNTLIWPLMHCFFVTSDFLPQIVGV